MTTTDLPPTQQSSTTGALVRALRPRQWVKNVLVLTAPAAAGVVLEPSVLVASAIAFVAFSLAASGVYLINDVVDVEKDRAHPKKRHRPIAAGLISPRLAVALGLLLLAAALGVASLADLGLVGVIGAYEAMSLAYCLAWKNEPVIDIAVVAGGFLLRAAAGGVAAGIELSQWFLLAATFGSLLMVSGKRYAEIRAAGPDKGATRASLLRYTDTYLRFVWTLSAGILIMTYGLWAFEIRETTGSIWAVISMVPFVLAVLRYAVDVDSGAAEEPEEIALRDRGLQVLGGIWLVAIAISVYA